VSPAAQFIGTLGGMLQMGGFVAIFFGSSILPEAVVQNKAAVIMGLFLFNNFAQQFMATGAFEIILDGELMFSKIELGRMPTVQELHESMSRGTVVPLN